MTAEEIKQSIVFKEERVAQNKIRITGKLVIRSEYLLSDDVPDDCKKELKKHAKDYVTELILSTLYEDQSNQLYDAIEKLARSNPSAMWFDHELIGDLLKSAMRQKYGQAS